MASPSELQTALQKALLAKQEADQRFQACQIERRELRSIVDNHSPSDKQSRELKAALADAQFQLKKLSEDIATERTMMELEKIKFMKGYEQKITELKDKIEHDNQDWIKRFDIQAQEYKEELERKRKQFSDQSLEEIKVFKRVSEEKVQEVIRQNKTVIEQLRVKITHMEKVHADEKEHMTKAAEEKLGRELKAIHDSTNQLIERKEREFEQTKSLVEREKKIEESKHQLTKKQFSGVKDNLYEQIYKLTTEKIDLEEQVKQLTFETEEKTRKIIALNESIRELEISHQDKIKNLIDSSKQTLDNIKNKSTGDFKQIYEAQLIYIDTITAQIATLQQKHQETIKYQKMQIENIKKNLSERPSKSQDIDIIKTLKERLWKKEKDLELSQEETTWYKRELENRDEMYTKLFKGGREVPNIIENRPRKESQNIKTMPISPVNVRPGAKSVNGRLLMGKRKLEELKFEQEPEAKGDAKVNNIFLQVPKTYV